MESMQTRIVGLAALSDGDLAAWRDLAGRAAEPNPFFEPEFVLPVAEALAPGQVSLVVVEDDDGVWRACAPVRRNARWRRTRLPCMELWTHIYSGLEVPLVDRGAVTPAVAALLDALRRGPRVALVAMTQVPLEGPYHAAVHEVLREGPRALRVETYERAALRRRPEPTYVAEAMSRKRRHEVGRLRRGLEREHPDAVAVVDRAGDEAAVADFLRLEASGWKGSRGTAMGSIPAHARFFREMCGGFARQGRLQLFTLAVDGRPIAMVCALRAGDRLFTFKMAYDDDWSRWSPGRLAVVDYIAHFHHHTDAVLIDSIADAGNEYMKGLWPDRLALCTMLVPARGMLGWAAGRSVAAALGLRSARARRAEARLTAATTN